jgi:hypothetical protein
MLCSLEKSFEISIEDIEKFKLLRSSKEDWEIFKNESTEAEFVTMEIIQEAFECQSDMVHDNFDKLKVLSEELKDRIPFESQLEDVTWEALHTALLTERVWFIVVFTDFRLVELYCVLSQDVLPRKTGLCRRLSQL